MRKKQIEDMVTYNPGDYCCVDERKDKSFFGGFIDKEIRIFTGSVYSHCFIVVSEDGDIVEAEPFGARLANLSEYAGEHLLFSNTNLSQGQRQKIVESARSYIGVPYNFLDIAYLGLALKGIKWSWMLSEVEEQKRMICSQLVAQCGWNATVPEWLCGQPHPQLVTPGMLASLAMS